MIIRVIRHFRRLREGQDGIAMVLVIGVGSVLAVLVVAVIAFSLGGLRAARDDQDWNGAMAAAYAGVEEYQSRLANDPTYMKYGNPAAKFTTDTGSTVSLPSGSLTNPAFGIGTTGTWSEVAQSGGTAFFRYEVDNSKYGSTGTLRIRSTGRVGKETRTIVADLKQQGFIDFLYFTDYEYKDPDLGGASCTQQYYWENTGRSCTNITFSGGDTINGPLHTNDTIWLCKATFNGPVTTASSLISGKRYYVNGSGCTSNPFAVAGSPAYSPKIGMPATNSQLRKETRTDLSEQEVQLPGCLYTGPTSIVFNSNGTMTVRSPWSKATNVSGDPATGNTSVPSKCGATGSSGLGSASGVTVPVPDNRVIFVQAVPSSSTGDPNYWAPGAKPTGFKCTSATSTTDNTGNGIGYPMDKEVAPSSSSYDCTKGDLFVKGTLDGHVTLAADRYVYVTGDLLYKDKSDDMLGLVGNGAVWVYDPVDKDNKALLPKNREIDAAILSVAHSFMAQNYDISGVRGTLTVVGAIAQKFRGTVGTLSGSTITNGYVKDYQYDDRFKYTAPPKFLSPVTTTYGVNVWVETAPAMSSDGAYR